MNEVFDYFKNCVHCGLCLQACPTYVDTADENDSPRGRIYLMQALAEGRVAPSENIDRHLELCLNCRGCDSACPSGVQYGELIEAHRTTNPRPTRGAFMDRMIDWVCQHILPHPRRTRWLLRGAAVARATGLLDFLRRSGFAARYAAAMRIADVVAQTPAVGPDLPERAEPHGARRATTALFRGCVSEAVFGHTNRATSRVLLANGCAVLCPATQACCGAIDYHAGRVDQARRLARQNIAAFESCGAAAVITNVAGCGVMLKSYDTLLASDAEYAERAVAFTRRVRDVHEYLVALPLVPPRGSVRRRMTYHDACHLCHGQGIRQQPRAILDAIPGLEVVELADSEMCCGAAGTYNLLEPEMAGRIARRKLAQVADTATEGAAIANAGCLLHLMQQAAEMGLPLHFVHPIDLLDEAYSAAP